VKTGAALFASLVFVQVLAACVGADGSAANDQRPDTSIGGLSEDLGAVQGTIVDDSVTPIANAQIQVATTTLVAVSGPDGSFLLGNVPPGRQTLFVVALGFDSVAKVVEVAAGAVTQVSVTMVAIPVRTPFHETFGPEKGYFECRLGIPSQTGECGWVSPANSVTGHPTALYPNDKSIFKWMLANNNVSTVIGDMRWTPGSFATSTAMRFAFSYDLREPSHRWCGWEGPTPLQFRWEQDEDGDHIESASQCSSDQSFDGPPTVDLNPMRSYTNVPFGNTQSPAYLALQQSYEVITTAFYYEAAPAEYQGFPDA
jgi:hypothetical protein